MPSRRRRLCAAALSTLLAAATAQAAQVLPDPAVDAAEGAGSVAPEPVQPRARTTNRLIYSCIAPGIVTYSDRPCGPVAVRRELKVATPAAMPGRTPDTGTAQADATDRRRAAAAKSDAAVARAAADRAETCLRLEAALDEIDARMRAGYPAREAGRLWDRWRAARADLREARC